MHSNSKMSGVHGRSSAPALASGAAFLGLPASTGGKPSFSGESFMNSSTTTEKNSATAPGANSPYLHHAPHQPGPVSARPAPSGALS